MWPKNSRIEFFKTFVMLFFGFVGVGTILGAFLFNEEQTRKEILDNIGFSLIMTMVFLFIRSDEWLEKLEKEKSKDNQ